MVERLIGLPGNLFRVRSFEARKTGETAAESRRALAIESPHGFAGQGTHRLRLDRRTYRGRQ